MYINFLINGRICHRANGNRTVKYFNIPWKGVFEVIDDSTSTVTVYEIRIENIVSVECVALIISATDNKNIVDSAIL